jgi:ligand-binding sensor domain-containing protein/two-component sensor histidine kinase
MTRDSIDELAVDEKDGSLWIGTQGGLLCYKDHHFRKHGLKNGIREASFVVWPTRAGGVWFPPKNGQVAWFHEGQLRTWEFGEERAGFALRMVIEETPTRLLVLLGADVYRLDLETRSLKPLIAPVGPMACYSFSRNDDGTLWLCTTNGIWHGKEESWTAMTPADARPGHWLSSICKTRDGQIWVTQTLSYGDRNNLERLQDGNLQPFSAPEFPTALNITRLLEDLEGNLWVGSTSGLFRFEPKRLKVYSKRDGLKDDEVQAVTESPDGTIWAGTADGISAIREGKVINLSPPEADLDWGNKVSVFLADRQNQLWVGRQTNSLACFTEGQWKEYPCPQALGITPYLSALYEDRDGRIWVGTRRRIVCEDRDQWTSFPGTNDLSAVDVRVIHQDRKGDMWFGTFGGGLNRLRDGKLTAYTTLRGEYNNRAWSIHEDGDGVFWIGSEDGLNRFIPPDEDTRVTATSALRIPNSSLPLSGRFFTFTTQHGLHENVINNIQEDDFGYLWLSGLRGIYRIARQQLNEVAAGQRKQVECLAYGEADGMLSSECNGGDNQPAGCKDHEGRLWFPTAQGVVVIDPKDIRLNDLPTPVVIEQVRAGDQVVFGDDSPKESNVQRPESPTRDSSPLRLGAGSAKVVEIHYTANSFTAPERVRFKYRLEGYDREWRDAGDRRVAFYTNLRPGSYRFEVLAVNSHGILGKVPALFPFAIAPHFWETWSFYLANGVVVLLMVFALHHRRVGVLGRIQRVEQQRALEEERTRIARDLHDDLGANLTGLALQLDVLRDHNQPSDAIHMRLASLAWSTRALVDNMREVVWAMNPQNDNLESLASFLGAYTESYLATAGLRCRLELPVVVPSEPVDSSTRHQLFLVVKETLHNIVRHARATEVQLGIQHEGHELRLAIVDNGCGLPADGAHGPGHGLDNITVIVPVNRNDSIQRSKPN